MRMILAWALYDLANTFFAVAMISFFFPLWLIQEQGVKELSFSIALGISMACVAVLMPFCGALSDATGQRMRFLRWTTYGCAAATALIGWTDHVIGALALFAVANVCYQLGTVFYDTLLSTVASSERLGHVSGLGAAFGYLGSMVGLLLLWPFVQSSGYQAAFLPSAVCFILFALPAFFMLRDPQPSAPVVWGTVVREAGMRLRHAVRSARETAGLWRFLWAAFFSLSAINTILVFMAVYTRKVMGLTDAELIRFFLFSQAFAVVGAIAFSRLIPSWGSKRTLWWIWFGWVGALCLLIVSPGVQWLWVIGPMIGLCLGSTWATSRVLLTELAPPGHLAETFGLAGLFARASSIIGPVLWGLIVYDPARYHQAVALMIAFIVVGLWLLRGVPQPGVQSR